MTDIFAIETPVRTAGLAVRAGAVFAFRPPTMLLSRWNASATTAWKKSTQTSGASQTPRRFKARRGANAGAGADQEYVKTRKR